MTNLYEEYKKEMELGILWNPENELGLMAQNKKDYKIAFVESVELSNHFELSIEYKKQQMHIVQQTPQGPVQIPQEQVTWRVVGQGWKKKKSPISKPGRNYQVKKPAEGRVYC